MKILWKYLSIYLSTLNFSEPAALQALIAVYLALLGKK